MKSELGCGGWMMFYYPREMMVQGTGEPMGEGVVLD